MRRGGRSLPGLSSRRFESYCYDRRETPAPARGGKIQVILADYWAKLPAVISTQRVDR